MAHSSSCHVNTETEESPYPKTTINEPVDLNITWWLQQLNKQNMPEFSINRNHPKCNEHNRNPTYIYTGFTPRRNSEILAAITYFKNLFYWSTTLFNFFQAKFCIPVGHELDLTQIHAASVFVPSAPLFERHKSKSKY